MFRRYSCLFKSETIKILGFNLFFFLVQNGSCQISKANGFEIYLGYANTQLRESVLNNILHNGYLFSTGVTYYKSRNPIIQKINFKSTPCFLMSRYENKQSSLNVFNRIKYSLLYNTEKTNKFFSQCYGMAIGLNSNVTFFENWDDSHIYWLTNYYLSINSDLKFHLNNNQSVNLFVGFPIINFISRPPEVFTYKVLNPKPGWIIKEVNENIRFSGINHLNLETTFAYNFSYNSRIGKSIYYELIFIKTEMPYSKQFVLLVNNIGLKISL